MIFGIWLPWLNSGSAALNHNAVDLAEWASLHPGASGETPAYLTALLLRLPLVILALLIGWGRGGRIFRAGAVIVTAAALLPPFEFLGALDNANYRQQAALALVALIGGLLGLIGLSTRMERIRPFALPLFAAAALGASTFGLLRALALRRDYLPATQIGAGIAVTMAAFGLLLLLSLLASRSHDRRAK